LAGIEGTLFKNGGIFYLSWWLQNFFDSPIILLSHGFFDLCKLDFIISINIFKCIIIVTVATIVVIVCFARCLV
jgi:hypothetical protein